MYKPKYTTVNAFPAGPPTATIYIAGLMCLYFDGTTTCTVGIVDDVGHNLQVIVYPDAGGKPCDSKVDLTPASPFEIKVTGGAAPTGVYVYAPGTGTRRAPRDDFALHVLDLEGPSFHNTKLGKNPLSPLFTIDNGIFYACQVSDYDFHATNNKKTIDNDLGTVAAAVAADIFLDPAITKARIELVSGGMVVKTLFPGRFTQVISITNECAAGSPSDFPLYYTYAVTGVATGDQFNLEAAPAPQSPTPCIPNLPSARIVREVDRESDKHPPRGGPSSDHVPCAPIVFGQTP